MRAEQTPMRNLFASQACIVAVGGFRAYTNRCGVETVAADHLGAIDPFPWILIFFAPRFEPELLTLSTGS